MFEPMQPISERRLAANRANALKSTGPRTAEGKARSSLNALRHGITGQVSIMTEEDRAAHDKFCQELIDSLRPEGPLEIQFASSIAEDFWRLQRIRALENDILALGAFSDAADIDVDHPEIHASLTRAQTFLDHSKDFERLTLYEQRVNRSIERNRKQLDDLQATRKRLREEALREACRLHQFAPAEPVHDGARPATSPESTEDAGKSGEAHSSPLGRAWCAPNKAGFVFSSGEIDRPIDRPRPAAAISAAKPLDRRAAQGVSLISQRPAS